MTDSAEGPFPPARLRTRAESLLRRKALPAPEMSGEFSVAEAARVLHELRVHQVELELQNEELRAAQVELNAARAKYFDLYDTAPIGYVTLNAEGMISEANLTAATMLATERGDLVNKSFYRYVVPEDRDYFSLARAQLLKSAAPQAFELRLAGGDGRAFWVRINATAFPNGDGATTCRFAISEITKLKLQQAEKVRLEEQLALARKMESVGRLAGGVAHNFNNMLMVILGYTEMAMERVGPADPFRDELEKIRTAAQSSAELIRQLLVFASKQAISPSKQETNTIIAGALKMIEQLIGENVRIVPRFSEKVWPVFIDPSQLEQLLLNLCLNARDAITEGSSAWGEAGTVTIETANVTIQAAYCEEHAGCSPGDYVLISVTDNGAGMSAATKVNIFEPFFTTKEIGYGTGLGLATVYGAVLQNRGFIVVESEPGEGATFKVYLPRYAAATKAEAAGEVLNPETRTPLHGSGTILLVEDDEAILAMVSTMLKSLGYRVYEANAPEMALHLARKHAAELDLLITDVVMPDMSGNVLAKKVAGIAPHAKELFMSGYTADLIDHHGVLDRGTNFIQKPFSVKHLALKVREVLGDPAGSGVVSGTPANADSFTAAAEK